MTKSLIIILTIAFCLGAISGCSYYQHLGSSEDSGVSKVQLNGNPSDATNGEDVLDITTPPLGSNEDNSVSNVQPTENPGDTTNGENVLDITTPQISIETPPDDYVYLYDSYTDIKCELSISSSDEYKLLRSEDTKYGVYYAKTLERFGNGDDVLYVPEINGELIALRDAEGYSSVSLMTCELYNLPWIWYHCTLGDESVDIKISYPGALESAEIEMAETYLDILKLIAPNAPSPSNYQRYKSYKSIYEKDIALSNGQVVTVMVSEMHDTSKIYVMLLINNTLVSVYGEAQLLSDEFWGSFDLAEYNGT